MNACVLSRFQPAGLATGRARDLRMRVLVIGGTGFIGSHITRELIRRDHHVTVFHRGRTDVPPGAREVVGDRRQLTESADNLRALAPDVVVDVVLSSGRQARELMNVFRGHARRVVALSSMDVYRACGVTHRLGGGPARTVAAQRGVLGAAHQAADVSAGPGAGCCSRSSAGSTRSTTRFRSSTRSSGTPSCRGPSCGCRWCTDRATRCTGSIRS